MTDWNFITALEGYSLKGYVPSNTSGVTLASGVDLGYLKLQELDPSLQSKLKPYLGLKGPAAKKALARAPLTITPAEADLLEAPKRASMLQTLAQHYDRDASMPFAGLPDAAQTVLMSVTWQYGTPWKRCSAFWAYACRGSWLKVIDELEHFGDDFGTRRNKEADYLLHHLPA
jgi:hypothetical protein